MTDSKRKDDNPRAVFERLRQRLSGGGSLLLDSLTDAELIAMQELVFKDEAEIVSLACKPYLTAKLDRTIIS